jgi:hypothetical protein
MAMGALSQGVNWQGREAGQLPPIIAEIKKTWVYTTTASYLDGVVLS